MKVLNKEDLDGDYVLKDGESLRVSMMLSDGVAIDPDVYRAHFAALNANAVVDAASHRPRAAVFTADQQTARAAAQAAYDRRIGRAYLDNAPASEADEQLVSMQERYRRNDERISSAWKPGNQPVKDSDTPKLIGMLSAMGAGSMEATFKSGAAAMETSDLAAARARYQQRLEAGWKDGK